MKPEENNTSYSIVKDFEIFLDEVTDETSEDYDPVAAFDLEVMDRVYEAQRSFENLKELLEESDGYANRDEAILLLQNLEEDCDFTKENHSILQKCSEAYSYGQHIPLIYADFFLVEAVLKLRGSDFLIW